MQLQGKQVFITGGLGFIGSHLVRRLVEQNQVTVYDNGRRDSLRLCGSFEHPNLTLIDGDMLDRDALAAALGDPDVVVHLAAIAGVSSYTRHPVRTMRVNFGGPQNLLELLIDRKVERFVNFSTSEVYGAHAAHVTELSPAGIGPASEPRWTYASSKLAAEQLCFAYHARYGLPVVSLRPFNIYGPGQLGEGALRNFVIRALAGEPLQINGDGGQVRAWCHIDDMIDALLEAIVRPEAVGELFNIGNPDAVLTIAELAACIIAHCGSASELAFGPARAQEIETRIPDICKAREMLGFSPRVGMDVGLAACIEWYRKLPERGVVLGETED